MSDFQLIPTRADTGIDVHAVDLAARSSLEYMISLGTSPETIRAIRTDLRYLEAWALAVTGRALEWPAPEDTASRFLAHHIFDARARENDAAHGMPVNVEAALRQAGFLSGRMPPALSTIDRRIASWSKLHGVKGLAGPFSSPSMRALRKTIVSGFQGGRDRKSPMPVTMLEVSQLLATCDRRDNPYDLRDHALISMMYASGGRRRSEPGQIRVRDLAFTRLPSDPEDPMSPRIAAVEITMPKTKTTRAGETTVWAIGAPAESIKRWVTYLEHQQSSEAFLFTRIYTRKVRHNVHGTVGRHDVDKWGPGLSGKGVRHILAQRAKLADLDPADFTPHGFRFGFLTDAQRKGVPLADAMQQSLHRSEKQAMSYYVQSAATSKAARLLMD